MREHSRDQNISVGFEVLTAVSTNMAVFCLRYNPEDGHIRKYFSSHLFSIDSYGARYKL
jgi:hypothetical protein